MQILSEIFENFTVDVYNETIKELKRTSRWEFLGMLCSSPLMAFLFPGWQFRTALDAVKLGWYFALPKVGEFGASKLVLEKESPFIDVGDLKGFRYDGLVINQVVTSGKNVRTVERTVKSIHHWYGEVERRYSVRIPHEVWIVVDEGREAGLRGLDARMEVVPAEYGTRNGSMFKARALQYAVEQRRGTGSDTWVYYHDEETVFGEDSVLGIAEFVQGDRDVGVHPIVYPVNWRGDVLSTIETLRTSNDVVSLSLSPRGMWHGSGFMVRGEVEREIGWDFGPVRAEDLLFHLRASRRFRYGVMKGFVYEIPPQNFMDFMRQRRRWILGILDGFKDGRMDVRNKVKYLLGLTSWYSSALGFLVPLFVYMRDASAPLPIGPYLTGPIWFTLLLTLKDGFVLTRRYAGLRGRDLPSFMVKGLVGLMLEAIAPWYTLFTGWRDHGFHVIDKG
ncbi:MULTISPECIES: glycosyltransferase family 2 protein [Metallosphaera]|uniref:glycosyltransferase family 2 protein n=1 Tax=Metallosphaera TaxID=41980 RepID=UPI001F0627D1|nr:glycosyltransferase family 2 protein [Metallosphaera sedula]MCH1771387.1 glycosyltransferase family 2 protein [Metallosphaera sedula]MCP6729779.1 glycosyltransferase family 2 protein [Metallosphaera sedula]